MAKVVRAYRGEDGQIYETAEEAAAADVVVLVNILVDSFEEFDADGDTAHQSVQLFLRKLIDKNITTKKKMEAMIDSIEKHAPESD